MAHALAVHKMGDGEEPIETKGHVFAAGIGDSERIACFQKPLEIPFSNDLRTINVLCEEMLITTSERALSSL